ncbi:hypothetical protein [Nocardiopsis sp. CA-288880]|uniref:hypothetical protein n=1 Tax=Nocardiopsis sp. CA-288880 TaxID=3239995 RepID=UPI003D955DBC
MNHVTDSAPASVFYPTPGVLLVDVDLPASYSAAARPLKHDGRTYILLAFRSQMPTRERARVVRETDLLPGELREAVAAEITRGDVAQAVTQ